MLRQIVEEGIKRGATVVHIHADPNRPQLAYELPEGFRKEPDVPDLKDVFRDLNLSFPARGQVDGFIVLSDQKLRLEYNAASAYSGEDGMWTITIHLPGSDPIPQPTAGYVPDIEI